MCLQINFFFSKLIMKAMIDVIKKTSSMFIAKQKGVLYAALLISVMAIVAKLFGLIRLRVFSYYFTPQDLDIYLASFRMPDFIFDVVFSGAIATAFIPLYTKYAHEKQKLVTSISSIINAVFLFVISVACVIFIFMPQIISLIVPGFSSDDQNQIVLFSRLILVGQLPFFILGNFLVGIGQANKVFLPSAIAPVVYNISIIAFTILFAQQQHLYAPITGVMIGAILFFIVQLPVIFQAKFDYQLGITNFVAIREFIRLVVPRTLTIIASQIDVFVDLTLTTLMSKGMYTVFYFSQHLMLLPISVIGYAYGQASLPFLTELYATGKKEEFKELITKSILNLVYISMPLAAIFIIARTPIVRIMFGGDEFNFGATNIFFDATRLTALTVSYFALSLPAHTLYYFILRVYYAMNDARTPFRYSLISIVINTILSVTFVQYFKLPVWSLAISFGIAMSINVLMLMTTLSLKLNRISYGYMTSQIAKIAFATIVSSLFGFYVMRSLDQIIINTNYTINILILLIIIVIGFFLIYFILSWALGLHKIEIFARALQIAMYKKKVQEVISITENN